MLALASAGMAGALFAGRTAPAPEPVAAASAAPQTPPAYTPQAATAEAIPTPQPAPVVRLPDTDESTGDGDEFEDATVTYPYATPALPPGTWFVVLGGARGTADIRMLRVADMLRGNGIDYQEITSDDYPGLNPGLVVLVEGPTTQAVARQRLQLLKGLVPDAYVKSGW